MLPRVQPINPSRIASAFDHLDWIFELKHDGFRAVAYIEDGACQLISRKNVTYKSFPTLCKVLAGLPVRDAIFDGELVCLDPNGRSLFMDLMRRRQDVVFYAFDVLRLDGEDMRGWPLLERKRRLRQLVRGRAGLLYAEHIERGGIRLFEAICSKDLEGVIAKHKDAPYTSAPVTWFKILNPAYTQKRGRREMFDKFHERRESEGTNAST